MKMPKSYSFQSTHPRGVRHLLGDSMSFGVLFQSTHPRGVRHFITFVKSFHCCFNPRTHAGCDYIPNGWAAPLILFQSTHPRGVRLLKYPFPLHINLFQSTHPRGVRQQQIMLITLDLQFQSTHPRGVRLSYTCYKDRRNIVSIHAPTRGATEVKLCMELKTTVSIHAPTRGATGGVSQETAKTWVVSIHAPTRGATSSSGTGNNGGNGFQSTHPRGVRHLSNMG